MIKLVVGIYSVSAVLCLLLSGYWLSTPALNPRAARVLGVNYLLYTCLSILGVLALGYDWAPAQGMRAVLAMLFGPALYTYWLSLRKNSWQVSPLYSLHLVPALAVATLIITGHPWRFVIDTLIILSFGVYLCLMAWPLLRGSQGLINLQHHAIPAYRWLCILTALLFIGLVVELGITWELSRGRAPTESLTLVIGATLSAIFHMFTLLLALQRSPLLEWMHRLGEASAGKWSKRRLEEKQVGDIFQRWEACVQEHEWYKQEGGITLQAAARKLGLPTRHLSESINRAYGASFSQYLNACRVAEAQRLLANHPDMPLTELMLAAGFDTKSHFNREFKRINQMSPSEYRLRQQVSPDKKF